MMLPCVLIYLFLATHRFCFENSLKANKVATGIPYSGGHLGKSDVTEKPSSDWVVTSAKGNHGERWF